jgi:hypothetical protein
MGSSGFKYRFVFAEILNYENHQFLILFYGHGVGQITYGLFYYTVALMAVTKAETLVYQLCAMLHSGEFKKQVLSATPRYATQCEIQAKNFLVDYALCIIAQSHLYLHIFCEFTTICKNDLINQLISDRSGIDWENNQR